MSSGTPVPPTGLRRREFLRTGGLLAAGASLAPLTARAADADHVELPFGNGGRELVAYPEKRKLIQLSARPPQLETPFSVFNESTITPNNAFFVRYHLAGIPTNLDGDAHRIQVRGLVKQPVSLSVADLKKLGDPVELVAVNQCSGNGRGLFEPRVGGGQLYNGAMGCARWKGIPLKAVLEHAGLGAGARQVSFEGVDRPVLPTTPEFVKALDLDHATDGEVMIAYEMNGEELPMLNGYPVRLIVPGYYGTYWVKHLATITVLDSVFDGFWMKTAYRVPNTPDHALPPGTPMTSSVPISRFDVRSFITSQLGGERFKAGRKVKVRGIAFDGGSGIRQVDLSTDGGATWQPTELGKDLGKYAFREFTAEVKLAEGEHSLQSRATANSGETQPDKPRWNPSGYMRNVIETVKVTATAVLALAAIWGMGAPRAAHAKQIELPAETAQLKKSDAKGYPLAAGYCIICHSADYPLYQPPHMSAAFWKAEVTKMKKVYGAPLPDEAIDPIADYLVKTYGAEAPH